MAVNDKPNIAPRGQSARNAVNRFLEEARGLAPVPGSGRGRLVFALDATRSRQPTWDLAQSIQGEMFAATSAQAGLDVQLVYFRGFAECRASSFVSDGRGLGELMSKISCRAGKTQIGRVLRHTLIETRVRPVGALIYVGDAVEEDLDDLGDAAGQLGLLGVKAFMFQEGADALTERAFREIAHLSGGAYAAFDRFAPGRLTELLKAAATYAAGGRLALEKRAQEGEAAARLLLSQI
jgi:hypothetical protein